MGYVSLECQPTDPRPIEVVLSEADRRMYEDKKKDREWRAPPGPGARHAASGKLRCLGIPTERQEERREPGAP